MSKIASGRLHRFRRRDVLHPGSEHHHGLVFGPDLRLSPHAAAHAGIILGVAFMVAAVGLGLGTTFIAYPVLQTLLKYAGAAYLIYLAAMIAMSGPAKAGEEGGRGPMTFWDVAVFQWVNVKGWVIVIGTITAYAAIARFPINIAIQTVLCLPWACSRRTLFGSVLRPGLKSEPVRAFNVLMALLLLASLYPVFRDA
jgi:threonine/homoserine/homoserine lactone efflux protein